MFIDASFVIDILLNKAVKRPCLPFHKCRIIGVLASKPRFRDKSDQPVVNRSFVYQIKEVTALCKII